ncbi:hypothetical protein DOY81_003235, partial [Sarcophaga bullata]
MLVLLLVSFYLISPFSMHNLFKINFKMQNSWSNNILQFIIVFNLKNK